MVVYFIEYLNIRLVFPFFFYYFFFRSFLALPFVYCYLSFNLFFISFVTYCQHPTFYLQLPMAVTIYIPQRGQIAAYFATLYITFSRPCLGFCNPSTLCLHISIPLDFPLCMRNPLKLAYHTDYASSIFLDFTTHPTAST